MRNAQNEVPIFCPSVYHPIIANPEVEQAGESAAERFSTTPLDLQGAFDGCKHTQCLF